MIHTRTVGDLWHLRRRTNRIADPQSEDTSLHSRFLPTRIVALSEATIAFIRLVGQLHRAKQQMRLGLRWVFAVRFVTAAAAAVSPTYTSTSTAESSGIRS